MNDFEHLIEELISTKFRTAQALADAIGISLSAFSRGVKNGSLSEKNLLLLAEVVGMHPSEMLRVAGKGDLADLIERVYGVKDKNPLTQVDRELLAMSPDAKRHLLTFVRQMLPAEEKPAKEERRKRSA